MAVDETLLKTCSKCGVLKAITEFRRRKSGYQSYCKSCQNEYVREWHKADGGKTKRDGYLRREYGIDQAEYDERLTAQGGVCAGCLRSPEEIGVLRVDHDHATGVVRGLLCDDCNRVLGMVRDSAATLRRLARYLRG